MFDIQQQAVITSFNLPGNGAARIYASPDKRYAVVVQRDDNQVSFVDSGVYVEDHGDHMHEYANDPAMSNFTLSGTAPTHYTQHSPYGFIFNDGGEGITSSVDIFSDSSIGQGKLLASLNLDNAMHGVAKWAGDKLFVTRRDASITDTVLPAEVERYGFDGTTLTFEHRYEEQCPLLHGAGANDDYLVFGCGDGVLSIDLKAADFPGTHYPETADFGENDRIGSVFAHHEAAALVGTVGFPQRRLFTLQPGSETAIAEIALPDGTGDVAQGFTCEGDRFYALTNDGQLHLFSTDDWSLADSLQVVDPLGAESAAPQVVCSQMEDMLFVLDVEQQSLISVNTSTASIASTTAMTQPVSNLTWLGFADHEHDH
ncbi:MAG TPA: hypothetical protein DD979_17685 [Gammaproteobacteria bacterium]|nr:hypothetical protein [Gammaproteobacteria bacterium]